MSILSFARLIALTLLAALALLPATARAQVDPAVVGTWQTMMPGPEGVTQLVWVIRADGTYTLTSDSLTTPAQGGTIIFGNGQWVLTATTGNPGASDAGTYQIHPTTLLTSGKSGVTLWQKSGSPGAPAQTAWPADLSGVVERASSMAQAWLADAVLIEARLELKPPTLTPGDAYATSLTYYSPSGQQRLSIMPGNPAGEQFPGGYADHTDRVPIPAQFMDLPAAIEWAHVLGMNGRAERADLGTWSNSCGTRGVGWTLWPIGATRTYDIAAAVVAPGTSEQIHKALASDQAAMIASTGTLLPQPYEAFSLTDIPLDEEMRKAGVVGYLQQKFPNAGVRDLLVFKTYVSRDAAAADFGHGQLQQKHLLTYTQNSDRGIEATCSVSSGQELVLSCEHLSPTLPVIVAGVTFEPARDSVSSEEYEQLWDTRTGRVMLAGTLYRRLVCGE